MFFHSLLNIYKFIYFCCLKTFLIYYIIFLINILKNIMDEFEIIQSNRFKSNSTNSNLIWVSKNDIKLDLNWVSCIHDHLHVNYS